MKRMFYSRPSPQRSSLSDAAAAAARRQAASPEPAKAVTEAALTRTVPASPDALASMGVSAWRMSRANKASKTLTVTGLDAHGVAVLDLQVSAHKSHLTIGHTSAGVLSGEMRIDLAAGRQGDAPPRHDLRSRQAGARVFHKDLASVKTAFDACDDANYLFDCALALAVCLAGAGWTPAVILCAVPAGLLPASRAGRGDSVRPRQHRRLRLRRRRWRRRRRRLGRGLTLTDPRRTAALPARGRRRLSWAFGEASSCRLRRPSWRCTIRVAHGAPRFGRAAPCEPRQDAA